MYGEVGGDGLALPLQSPDQVRQGFGLDLGERRRAMVSVLWKDMTSLEVCFGGNSFGPMIRARYLFFTVGEAGLSITDSRAFA